MNSSNRPEHPSPSAVTFEKRGYRIIGHDGVGLRNNDLIIIQHLACGTTRSSHITLQKAVARDWKICPVCHGAEQRRTERTREEILARAEGLSLRIVEPLAEAKSIRDTLRVSCTRERDGVLCGYERDIAMRSLFHRKTGAGCPACAGNLLTPEMVSARAAPLGLSVRTPAAYQNLDSVLTFRCANGHEYENSWGNQRNRGCPRCSRPTGERLIAAFCRIYWPEANWQEQYSVPGLDPDHPERRAHRYDLAAPDLKLLIENHSALHDDPGHAYFRADRPHDDRLKERAVAVGGALEGWRLVVLRWSEEDLRSLLGRGKGGIAALVADFRDALARQHHATGTVPIALPIRDLPTTQEFVAAHSDLARHVDVCRERGFEFMPEQFWAGLGALYRYHCAACGFESEMSARKAIALERPCQACGRRQTWPGFVHACDAAGFDVLSPNRPVDTKAMVTLRCREHGREFCHLRQTVTTKLQADGRGLCPDCQETLPRVVRRRPGGGATWWRFVEAFAAAGWDVPDQPWQGTSLRGGGVQHYEIVHRHCGTKKSVPIHQALQKLDRNGKYGCGYCTARDRRTALGREAAKWGLVVPPDSAAKDSRTPVELTCPRKDCPRGGTCRVSYDNLRRRGPPCRVCRS